MIYIDTPHAPAPQGHYSQAVVADGIIYVAAQLPLAPATGEIVGAHCISEQTRRVLSNCAAVLRAAGSRLADVLSITFYLTDLEDWQALDAVASEIFGAHRPSRSVIGVAAIRKGCLVQASMIARADTV